MTVDRVLLDQLYRAKLVALRERAESKGLPKNGSVEVVRARLIKNMVLGEHDLSWDGIQSMTHQELGDVLKIFGIKSSGSHKERRQRLWLHLNFDSRRMSVENLAEMERHKLHGLCQKLELTLTGTRTVLMGRVAGVLTSQGHGWGQIKRSLKRNGLPDVDSSPIIIEKTPPTNDVVIIEAPSEPIDFLSPVSAHILEDVQDTMISGTEKSEPKIKTALSYLVDRIDDIERMVGTILNSHGGRWSSPEEELFLRIAVRKGWPVENDKVKTRILLIASRLAEEKGAVDFEIQSVESIPSASRISPSISNSEAIERIRAKMTEAEQIISGLR